MSEQNPVCANKHCQLFTKCNELLQARNVVNHARENITTSNWSLGDFDAFADKKVANATTNSCPQLDAVVQQARDVKQKAQQLFSPRDQNS